MEMTENNMLLEAGAEAAHATQGPSQTSYCPGTSLCSTLTVEEGLPLNGLNIPTHRKGEQWERTSLKQTNHQLHHLFKARELMPSLKHIMDSILETE